MPKKRPGLKRGAVASVTGVDHGLTVVAIGASAGGLDACRRLLDALPPNTGMAFIFVQHLDPTHHSLVAGLLSSHTKMPVQEAGDGMLIEPDHLYVIPPGSYLSVRHGGLHLTHPKVLHGARLPFDYLLQSVADSYGPRGVGIILSGTGSDGSLGLKALKERGGLVIAQDPQEASYDGMPRNAIETAAIKFVCPLRQIPGVLTEQDQARRDATSNKNVLSDRGSVDWFADILELLRTKTTHDFTLYKPGTLRRRIERRMAMRDIAPDVGEKYVAILQNDPAELDRLTDNLFINVTRFFRDPEIFTYLADVVIPDLISHRQSGQPIRVWVAGCSTGEEAYSLAMLFRERSSSMGEGLGLQVFASDADPEAIATAREARYPASIAADVSPGRLAQFFVNEGGQYRISPELRSAVVFTVHNVLSDPPFSRIDLISCRNLLIYLSPVAQAEAISMFHFALRDQGVLVLGTAESIAGTDTRFQAIAKSERIYRHHRQDQQNMPRFLMKPDASRDDGGREGQIRIPSRPNALADLCRRLILETYAPAAVLINRKYQCLYTLGPLDRYLSVAPGPPSVDLFAMAREGLRGNLRAAIQRSEREKVRVLVPGRRADPASQSHPFNIAVQPLTHEGETLFLVCFLDDRTPSQDALPETPLGDATKTSALEHELEITRKELQIATRDLEVSHEEQRAVSEEASSVNEEYQSTNEELLTSKEELQSLNEELVTLNHQLQETLGRERTILDDLQNVMHSTDVATLLLDTDLHIRLFTPAMKSLFNILPSDVGRPLADLRSLTGSSSLEEDARQVLRTSAPMEREVQTDSGEVFRRRMLPYRSREQAIAGVVITFVNVTAQRQAANALEAAKQQADQANAVKSRFLAVASHDLRQPLQTLTLLQGLLAKVTTGERGKKLVDRLDETLDAMSGILNTLLDINRIESGTVVAETTSFPINELLQRLTSEFVYHAHARGVAFHKVDSSVMVHSDPRLLEQILRNFLSNALKYTRNGRVLIGCRRHQNTVSIEVWDTGIGIPESEYQAIFEEYHQLDNSARERSRGLGLGLSIVRQLGRLLGHPISVKSRIGKGSVFAVEVGLEEIATPPISAPPVLERDAVAVAASPPHSTFLVVDDDPGVRDLLVDLLDDAGHRVFAAADGVGALDMVSRHGGQLDLILADYNLPDGMNGLQVTAKVREMLHRPVPAIVLTGDISTALLREIAQHDCVHLNKPVKLDDLLAVIRSLVPDAPAGQPARDATPEVASDHLGQTIYVVDDDANVRDALRKSLEESGLVVATFPTSEAFLAAYKVGGAGCLLVDAYLPGIDGLALLQKLQENGASLPSIMITGFGDVAMAVHAMKAGAMDFIEKPVGMPELLASIERALVSARDTSQATAWHDAAIAQIASLTPRQRDIMERVLAGHPSKNIAADLGISQRTVENHRAAIMKRTCTKSLPALARLAIAASGRGNAV